MKGKKILLYAGNSSISNPLVSIALGKIYLESNINYSRQSAGNFSFSRKVTTNTNPPVKLTGGNRTYNSFLNLPSVSE